MKELSLTERIMSILNKYVFNESHNVEIARKIIEVTEQHYENKWGSVLDEGTPLPKSLASRIGSISEDVIFMAEGLPRLGFYDYIGKTWQAQGFKTFKGADVTIWHPLPELPTPPNSDKNVQDK